MKLRYLFTALLFTGRGRAPASPKYRPHAQTPARDPAGDRLPRKGAGRDAQTAERAAAGRIDRIRRRGDRRRHAPFGQRRSDDRPVQRQHMEIPPQPRLRQGQRNLHPLLGHDQTLSLPRRGEARRPAAFGGHRAGRLAQMLPLPYKAAIRSKFGMRRRRQASGRRPAR